MERPRVGLGPARRVPPPPPPPPPPAREVWRRFRRACYAPHGHGQDEPQFHLVLELTRRSGVKCVLLEVPLPRAVNRVTSRLQPANLVSLARVLKNIS